VDDDTLRGVSLAARLDRFARTAQDVVDVGRVRELLEAAMSPRDRTTPLHVTSSALVIHPASGRVLLRWHERQQAWLQIGGHGDPGEDDPLAVALREGCEETGLTDLQPWPDDALRQVVVVPVPATDRDRAHEHADLRFFLSTRQPDAARPERPGAELRWLSVPEALELATEANVRETIRRASRLLPGAR
jgi:8-oxo-dGTP pyrophosphatase MutT (NUDIX family)